MKQCPRCKSMLAKAHGEKMVCRTCGFVTKHLQVARENQQFQQRHHFGKKITVSKNIDHINDINQNTQHKNHYLVSFQNLLRTSANNLSKQDIEYKQIEVHARYVWMAYINMANQHKIDIAGIFRKYLKTKKRNNNTNAQSKQQQGDNNQQNKEQENQNNQQEQLKNNQQQQQKQSKQILKRKRGRKKRCIVEGQSTHEQKKIPFKLHIRRKLIQLNQSEQDQCEEEQRIKFLQYLYLTNEKQIDNDDIDYMSNKYSSFLVQQLRNHNLNIGVSYAKGISVRTSIKQLQKLVKMRGLKFTQKNQMHIVLLLQDLLRKWSEDVQIQQQLSLQSLLLLYKSIQNPKPNHLISQIIKRLMSLMQQQQQMQNQNQHKIAFPELSLGLLYAILYIAGLLNSNTLTISDIASSCGRLTLMFKNKKIISEQRINDHKIRKIAAILLRLLNLKCQASSASIKKWVQKYTYICGLGYYMNQITKLSQTLFQSYQINKHQKQQIFAIDKRYSFLQQDIISKAFIIIFIKLQIGFQNYPYLSTFPPQLLTKLQLFHKNKQIKNINNQQLNLLKSLAKQRGNLISIPKIIKNITTHFNSINKRSVNIRLNYSINNYSSLENLNMKNLIFLIKKYTFNANSLIFTINVAKTNEDKTLSDDDKIKLNCRQQRKQYKLSNKFKEQIEYVMKENESFSIDQLDLPSSNYQFFYQYMANIKHVGRDQFVLFAQTLSGRQCKMRQLYQWLQRMETVMVDFQN